MRLKFNEKAAEEFRQDLRKASWVASAAIYGSAFFGLPKEYSLIGAAVAWMSLQATALILGFVDEN
jgi:hypothetical protein